MHACLNANDLRYNGKKGVVTGGPYDTGRFEAADDAVSGNRESALELRDVERSPFSWAAGAAPAMLMPRCWS